MPAEEETYYTPERVAAFAGCVIQTIYRHLELERFPGARRIGSRKWIIPEQSVIDYLGYDPKVQKIKIISQ